MSLKDDILLLSQVPLFAGLDEEPLRLLAFGAQKQRLPEGAVLVAAGDRAEGAYVVSAGELALSTAPRVVESAGPGTLLCELALITEIDCRVTAVARQESEVVVIPRGLFHRLMEEFPDVALRIDERIRRNLEAMVREITRLGPRFS